MNKSDKTQTNKTQFQKNLIELFNKNNRSVIASQLNRQQKLTSKRGVYSVVNPSTGEDISGNLQYIADNTGFSPQQLRRLFKQKRKVPGFEGPLLKFKNMKEKDKLLKKIIDNNKIKTKAKKDLDSKINYGAVSAPDWNELAFELGNLTQTENVKTKKGGFTARDDLWKNNKFNTINQTFLYQPRSGIDAMNETQTFFDDFKNAIQLFGTNQKLKNNDKIRVIFYRNDGSVLASTKYLRYSELANADIQAATIANTIQDSAGGGYQEEDLSQDVGYAEIFVVRNPLVAGRGKVIGDKSKIYTKKSIIKIKNDDYLCLGRCIVIALAKKDNRPDYKGIASGQGKKQTVLTEELYEKYEIDKGLSDMKKIKTFEKCLDCCITVIDGDAFNNVIYPDTQADDYKPKDFNIYLYKTGEHFDLINSNKIAGFFGTNYFCEKCKKTYSCKDKHKCSFKCKWCCCADCDAKPEFKDNTEKWINCPDCQRNFPTQKCFDNHKAIHGKQANNMCSKIFKCPDCKKIYDKKTFCMETHKCGEYFCRNCECVVDKDHRCYMMPKNIKKHNDKYIFFDFEARQETGKHIVNYCIAQYFDDPEPIEFFDRNSFCKWIFQEKHKNYTLIAHNGRGYDYQFIMRWLYRHTTYKPYCVYAGSKIMTFSVKQELNIRFVDSLNFLTMPLEQFPKTFGITELKKGFFPHFFNTEINMNYEGPIPDIDYFKPNGFKDKKRKEFYDWYETKIRENYVWNQKREMREYCISDVDILRRCCIKFRQLYIDVADIDPFQYTTIASVCMAIYKAHHIIPNYNTDYWNIKGDKDAIEQFKNDTRKQVFDEKKICILSFEEQAFIRKSFFGGRTNAIKLKYNFKDTEEGKYADITSLYPTVNYYDEYPVGAPIWLKENDMTDEIKQSVIDGKYFGFIECHITPPNDLYFPVLAEKGKKLCFDLKPKRGVWCSNELNKAIECGYVIDDVYSVMYFEKRQTGLFKSYIEKFLKIKQEATGWPDWCKTEEDKQKYINDYKEQQNIILDYDNIKKNPGLRALAKLCLNSLWGKFGMRLNMAKNEIVDDVKKFNEIMFNDEKYIDQDFNFIDNGPDDNRVELKYKMADEYVKLDFNTNLAVASFTTSSARLRLYEGMEKLQSQVLYTDTDSIVYKYDPENPEHNELDLGDTLGDWTDELEGSKMINTFISGGPKNYSYETDDGKSHTKIKGFTLNYETIRDLEIDGKVRKGLNHQTMIDIVNDRDKDDNFVKIDYSQIVRKPDKALYTVASTKTYSFCYDKRYICEPDENGNIDTLPFGHKDI